MYQNASLDWNRFKTHHHCPTRNQIDSLVGKDHITPGIGQVHIHLSNLGDSNETISLSSSRCFLQPGCYFVKVGISYKILFYKSPETQSRICNINFKPQVSLRSISLLKHFVSEVEGGRHHPMVIKG